MDTPPPNPPTPGATPGDGRAREGWARVQALFGEALERPAAERGPFLADVAEREPELAAEVRSLLDAHAASSSFLDEPAAPPAAALMPGERLGPYRIVGEIGRGGIGVVYRASRDDDAFTRDVAIKLIDPGMRSDEVLRRFRAERRILALLEHPNIARLLDGGTAPDGGPYLVMEHVEGRPLLEWCDTRRLPIGERLAIFLVVCDAVRFAHRRLVVHRDLKSENVLVTADGSPRLLDFGIAKLIAPEGAEPATLTAPMRRMLTPEYASPEQVRGEPATVSTDVYSLGVVLYELLVGSRPHRFQTRTPEEILRVVTQVDPPRPSVAVARAGDGEAAARRGETASRLARRLAGDLDYIVLKAIERDPARRYGSVDQLAQDLRRHLAGEAVLARGRSSAYLLSRFARRHRTGVATAGVVLLTLVAGVVATAWQAGVARRERDVATRRFDDVRRLAHAVLFDLHDAITSLPGSTRARELLVQHALRYLDDLDREAGGDPGLRHEMGVAYAKIADVQGRPGFPNLGQTGAALASYGRAIRLLDGAAAAAPESTGIRRDRILVSQRLADLLGAMGRHDEARREALGARGRIEAELAKRPDDALWRGDLCVASNHLIDLHLAVGDTAAALAECRTNLSLSHAQVRAEPGEPEARRGLLIAEAKTANVFGMLGERDSALAYYVSSEARAREALASRPENTDASRDLSIIYGMHGMFLSESGHVDSALAVYRRGLDITAALAAADPANALPQQDAADGDFQLATILGRSGRHAEAERSFASACERYERIAAADSGNAGVAVGFARSARGAGEACLEQSRRARTGGERARANARARAWLARSLERFRALRAAGALAGEDTLAVEGLERELAGMVPARARR